MTSLDDPVLTSWRFLWLVLALPLLALFWFNPGVLALGLVGLAHAGGHAAAARGLGIPFRPQIGFGPRISFVRVFDRPMDIGLLPGASTRMDLSGVSAGRTIAALLAGPIGAFVSGLVLVVVLLTFSAHGRPTVAPVGGWVEPGSAAEQAGLMMGDRVQTVDGEEVQTWDAVRTRLLDGGVVALQDGRRLSLPAEHGLYTSRRAPVVALEPGGTWAQAGVQPGDTVVSVAGEAVDTFDELAPQLGRAGDVTVRRGEDAVSLTVAAGPAGVVFGDRLVGRVGEGSAAAQAGIEAGDHLVTVDGEPILHWGMLPKLIVGKDDVQLGVVRDGAVQVVTVRPTVVWTEGVERRLLGVERWPRVYLRPVDGPTPGWGPSLAQAVADTRFISVNTLGRVASLVRPSPSPSFLGGPVAIFRDDGLDVDWSRLLGLLVLNGVWVLTLYNLLPLPGSAALTGLDEALHRTMRRRLPLRAYAVLVVGVVGLLWLGLFGMDLARWSG
jgi:membrane-associated protease RseP (regulator of RpoE activity)